MEKLKRKIYYVIHCTAEERDKGTDHYESFLTKTKAIKRAKEISENEFIAIEFHNEFYEDYMWQPDFNMGENWFERIEF